MDWLLASLGAVDTENYSDATTSLFRDKRPAAYWSAEYKREQVTFIVDLRVEEGREEDPCLIICGTSLNARQVRTLLPIPSFLMLYNPIHILHGEIKCLVLDHFAVDEFRRISEKKSFWTHCDGVVTIDWPKILPEVYTFPSSFTFFNSPMVRGTILWGSFPLDGASLSAFLDGHEGDWDAVGPIDLTTTSAEVIYSVEDDDGPITDVFLKTRVHRIDCFQPSNVFVSLPALNPVLQSWDIVLGKKPKGKLKVYGLALRDEDERKRLLGPKEPHYWGNTWYLPQGLSQPSKAQYLSYCGLAHRDQKGQWVEEGDYVGRKLTKLESLTPRMDVYLCTPFPSKALQDTYCEDGDPYRNRY